MTDFNSSLPVRTENNGDVVINLADGTTKSQLASVDGFGSLKSRVADAAGDVMGSQSLSGSFWLQEVSPSNGPASPGSAALYSNLMGGIFNSTLPTLTTGQQSAIQVNSSGVLLTAPVTDISPVSQTITAQDVASTSTSEFNGQAFITGTPTTGSAASFAISSIDTIRLEVTGTWTGTLAIEISQDGGTTWVATGMHQTGTAYNIGIFTNNVIGSLNVAACTNFRVRATAAWTGTATVKVVESININYLYVANPIKLVDSTTSVEANILAASTPASATNTSLVVALSPNSPLVNFPSLVDTNYGAVGASTIRVAAQLGNATGAIDYNNGVTDAQTIRVAANLAIGGANVTVANPVPVTITSASAGVPIQAYLTSASLAAGSTATLTYTVPATHTFSLERVWSSASGKIKTVVQNNGSTIYVGFNSTANPNIDMVVTAPPSIAAGVSVTVLITNEDKAAFDVYATVEGNQIS